MADPLVTTVLKIRDCGHDEFWLRDIIYDNPSVLGLGDLQAVMKEKTQSQGGRLDLLLKDSRGLDVRSGSSARGNQRIPYYSDHRVLGQREEAMAESGPHRPSWSPKRSRAASLTSSNF